MAKAVSRVVSGSVELPALFAPDRDAARRLVEFFTANIRNPNTRRAYARAAVQYATWCEAKYVDPYIPEDLRKLPGNWRSRIPGYYGCVQAIDDCVGTLVAALEKTGHIDDSVVLFFSDHGCTFRTRFGEYKRSPHDSSIRVPFVIAGPGFGQSAVIDEVVSLVDLTPTLLDAAGIRPPSRMRG
jgi:arylsulfatase A-like enzyme